MALSEQFMFAARQVSSAFVFHKTLPQHTGHSTINQWLRCFCVRILARQYYRMWTFSATEM